MATYTNFAAILALGGGGGGTLASALASGNTTGPNDIEFSSGQGIVTTPNAGPGFDLFMRAGDATAGVSAGGDLDLFPGLGFGGGPNGTINLNGDVIITGTLTLPNLISGAGTPEGAVAAAVSTIYQRTDGGAGNSAYIKMSGAGITGWSPVGPQVFETFVAVGVATFVTSRNGFDDPTSLGVDNLAVFWNGLLQREGALDDYTVAFNTPPGFMTITFVVNPTPGDFITIKFLPA